MSMCPEHSRSSMTMGHARSLSKSNAQLLPGWLQLIFCLLHLGTCTPICLMSSLNEAVLIKVLYISQLQYLFLSLDYRQSYAEIGNTIHVLHIFKCLGLPNLYVVLITTHYFLLKEDEIM